jgi:hypothetical protein
VRVDRVSQMMFIIVIGGMLGSLLFAKSRIYAVATSGATAGALLSARVLAIFFPITYSPEEPRSLYVILVSFLVVAPFCLVANF